MSGDDHAYAVFHRDVGYDDESYNLEIGIEFERQLALWQAGEENTFDEAWVDATTQSDAPPWMGPTFGTLEEAKAAAAVEHARRCDEMTLVDFGFQSFGARYLGPGAPSDLDRLRIWCDEHDVELPPLDPSLASVRVACDRIISRSLEGEMWADFLDEGADGAACFAADIVADELRRDGRDDLVAELYGSMVGEFTFVGPAIGQQSAIGQQGASAEVTSQETSSWFKRLFGR